MNSGISLVLLSTQVFNIMMLYKQTKNKTTAGVKHPVAVLAMARRVR
jgi:hypothetical protein